ncbi:MAG TPA: hypothetical protein VFU72_10260, partial [Nitrolancea sp.]|nr:hypothetical protein [Nitrolancea sp.]
LLLLVTYRSDELTRRHLLYQLLPLLVRESHAQRLDLHPLDDTGLRALVAPYALPPAEAARLAAYLDERSEGNPFFAGELLRALEEGRALRRASDGWRLGDLAVVGVPPLLRQVLDVRLDRLGEDARDLLAVAAVIGQTVPFAVWQAVAGADEGALLDAAARATAAHLLTETPDGSGVRFAHALVREALYEGLLLPRRRAWHRRAAEALVAQPHPDPDPIAHHFRRAGDARAADWLVAAGEQAEGAFAWLSAAASSKRAAALLDAAGGAPTRRGWLHFRLASLRQFADPQRSLADLGEAARLADAGGDAALAAGATYQRGKFLYNTGERRRGLEAMASGDRVITALPPPARARLAAGPDAYLASDEERRGSLAEHFAVVGRYAEAGALTGWSSDDPAGDAAAPTGREALALAFAHIALGRPAAARRALGALRRAELRLARHAPLLELVWVALPYRADHLAERGTLAAEAAAVWTATSGLLPAALPNPARLPLLIVEGGWAEARAHAEAGYAVGAGGTLLVCSRFGALARVQGDAALARTLAHEEFPLGPDTPPGDADYLDALGLLQLAAALALDAGE